MPESSGIRHSDALYQGTTFSRAVMGPTTTRALGLTEGDEKRLLPATTLHEKGNLFLCHPEERLACGKLRDE
jgi:hypothetical protein